MSVDPATTIVTPDSPLAALGAVPRGALARLAFGSVPSSVAAHSLGPRHLAFLPPESLELDLADPAQCQFGDYELVSKLGQGGMGVVYRARQRSLERDVALKLLSAGPWASRDFIERFRREAQSAARMQHPNIVAIYEIGSHDELNFFSMRLVEGVSLAHQLQESGPLNPKRAAQLMRTVAEALDYAHRLGVLHLDLKPANVLIDERGEPQVADFGLARRLDETLTRDNDEVSGTPSYMAPEQAQIRSHKLSQATDIYGLGAILYELLTGRPPFLGASAQDTLRRVIEEQPAPPRELNPGIPLDLEAVCLKCLSKEPGERYLSARALADDLARFVDGRPVSVRPLSTLQRTARWARREPRLAGSVAFAALALVAGLVATTSQWRRADVNAQAARATAWSQRTEAMWHDYDGGDWLEALPRLVDNLREQEAAGAGDAAASERRRIGVLLASSPRLIDLIALGNPVIAASVSPDGTRIAAYTRTPTTGVSAGTMHLIDANTGAVLWRSAAEDESAWPEFSLDGSTIRTYADVNGGADGQVDGMVSRRLDARTGALMPVPDAIKNASLLVYSGDGSLALAGAGGTMRSWRADTWQPLGPERPFAPDSHVLVSEDGGTVAYVSGTARRRVEIYTRDLSRTRSTFELAADERTTGSRISRDGRSLLLITNQNRIVLVDTQDGSARTLAQQCEAGIYVAVPAFSEDGAWVAASCADLRTSVWQVSDGRLVARPIRHSEEVDVIELDHARRLLFAHEFGHPRVYRLPPVADPLASAISLSPQLNGEAERNYFASAFDPAHGLLVFGTQDGRLRLWRMPRDPVLPVAAPPLETPDLAFDGEHVLGVAEGGAQVHAAANGVALGKPLPHPRPVNLGWLSPDGNTAFTASAWELRAWDWRSGTLRYPPLVLAETPLRVVPSPDGTTVLTSVGEYQGERHAEHLQLWRAADGKLVGEAVAPGPLFGARFSADGARLITWRGNAVRVYASADLSAAPRTLTHVDENGSAVRVVDARMASGDELHVTTARRNINYAAYYWRWDTRDGSLRERLRLVGMAHSLALAPTGAIANYGWQHDAPRQFQRQRPGAPLDWLPLPHNAFLAPGLAYSADGRWLAEASIDAALLVDARSNAALSPPLRVSLAPVDTITQFAFDAGARRLLARTAYGRWLAWDVAEDARPLAAIEQERRLYAPRTGAGWIGPAPEVEPAVRAALRATDPGAPADGASDARDPNVAFAPRAADSPPSLLDLGTHYTPLADVDYTSGFLFDLRSVPAGRQRFLGVEFDVRGLVQLKGDASAPPTTASFPRRVDGIELPEHVAALDLLVGDYEWNEETSRRLLDVVLHYRDGGERTVELSLKTGVLGYPVISPDDGLGESEAWRGGRVAWLGRNRQNTRYAQPPSPLYLMHVLNPEPTRALSSLSLVAQTAPYVLAITAETEREGRRAAN